MNEAIAHARPAYEHRTWVMVCGGFHRQGGMDKANFALATYLAGRGRTVHLVGRDLDGDLCALPTVTCHRVSSGGSILLGEILLERTATKIIARETLRNGREPIVVANGSNLRFHGVNWVHYVHHAWDPGSGQGGLDALKDRLNGFAFRYREKRAIRAARLVIANSERTGRDLLQIGIERGRIHVVYLGAEDWGPVSTGERGQAREVLAIEGDAPVVCFVGAMSSDDRKGFATLMAAWKILCVDPHWNAVLLVAGTGSRLEHWKRLASETGLSDRLRFLGFTGDVRRVLAASDILVSPVHYEPYGLNVQEALARGLPAIVSESAGVAERYTGQDRELLLADPDDAEALAGMLRRWSGEMDRWRARFRTVALSVQKESWNSMAETMANLIEVAYESADDFRQLPVSS